MKVLITLFTSMLLTCLTSNLTAQVTDSLEIIPANPTTMDTVEVICYTTWMNVVIGPQPYLNSSLNINNNEINVYSTPIWGTDSIVWVLPVLWNSIDTITVGRLNAGTYDLTYHLGSISDTTITFQVQTTPGCIDSSLIDSIVCTTMADPVCGCDNITYSNDCYATNYGGVTSFTYGPCVTTGCIDSSLIDDSIGCLTVYDPVCGCDNITYSNDCHAINYGGVTSYTYGPCVTTGIKEKTRNRIKTYPNPVTSSLVVETRYPLQLAIYNIQGKLMLDKAISSTYTMDLSHMAKGLYFLTATDEQGSVYSQKIIKE